MLFSYQYKFLYIHIAKTGGTSLRKALKPFAQKDSIYWLASPGRLVSKLTHHKTATMLPRHGSALTAYEMLPSERWGTLFKFAFVRNPWDLQVSSYHHIRREAPDLISDIKDFKQFINWKFDGDLKPYHVDIANHPQTHYVCNHYGEVILDFIGRYENYAEDTQYVLSKLGITSELPHFRKSNRKGDWREYYDDETAEIVAKKFAPDLELFNYEFG